MNMEYYFNTIVSYKDKQKIKISKTKYSILNYLSCFFLIISIIGIVIGLVYYLYFKNPVYLISALIVEILGIVTMLYADYNDPLKGKNFNSKTFVYLFMLKDALNNIKENNYKYSYINREANKFLISKLSSQIYKTKLNIENSFIFSSKKSTSYTILLNNLIDILQIIKIIYKSENFITFVDSLIILIDNLICEYGIHIQQSTLEEYDANLIIDLSNKILVKYKGKTRKHKVPISYILKIVSIISLLILFIIPYLLRKTYPDLFNFMMYYFSPISLVATLIPYLSKKTK